MLNPMDCEPGKEQYEQFKRRVFGTRRKQATMYQYDYRTKSGLLFSCVRPSLARCRIDRDEWLKTLIKCPHCGKENEKSKYKEPDETLVCPECGYGQ